MLQAVKQSTLGARDLSCVVFGFGKVFVGSGTPTLYFIAPQNSNVRRPNMSCLNPLRKYFSLRVHVTLNPNVAWRSPEETVVVYSNLTSPEIVSILM